MTLSVLFNQPIQTSQWTFLQILSSSKTSQPFRYNYKKLLVHFAFHQLKNYGRHVLAKVKTVPAFPERLTCSSATRQYSIYINESTFSSRSQATISLSICSCDGCQHTDGIRFCCNLAEINVKTSNQKNGFLSNCPAIGRRKLRNVSGLDLERH